jgi:hypothetical protein
MLIDFIHQFVVALDNTIIATAIPKITTVREVNLAKWHTLESRRTSNQQISRSLIR